MTRETHIKLLLQHLDKLLAEAEKRTAGRWKAKNFSVLLNDSEYLSILESWTTTAEDAIFIASCAGNAEAGWRATRAIASWILATDAQSSLLTDSILESWPIELLQ